MNVISPFIINLFARGTRHIRSFRHHEPRNRDFSFVVIRVARYSASSDMIMKIREGKHLMIQANDADVMVGDKFQVKVFVRKKSL